MKKLSILGFSSSEQKGVFLILIVLFSVFGFNITTSLRKARDSQRRSDVRSIKDGLKAFHEDFGYYPLSFEGKIVSCDGALDEKGVPIYQPCEWLYDSLRDSFDLTYPAYLESIPTDPRHNDGGRYYYISNGSRFQVYGAYESSSEPEYNEGIVSRGLMCGNKICNFGRGHKDMPLDISIEEFESKLDG